jgi:hypothetical protein
MTASPGRQRPFNSMFNLVAVESDGNLIESKGRVVHSCKTEDGKYESGISFASTELENARFALKLIEACHKTEPTYIIVKGMNVNS